MKLSDRERKLILLGFDPGAGIGEALNAIRALAKAWVTKYPDGHSLIRDLESPGIVQESPFSNFRLPFGRHKGLPLRSVPTDYLVWVLCKFDGLRPETRLAIERYLDWKK
jgi:hypothetical protein